MKITKELIEEFLRYYKNQNLKPDTIRGYEIEIHKFFYWFSLLWLECVEQISMKIINDWKSVLAEKKCSKNSIYYWKNTYLSERTIQTKIQPIKRFLEFTNVIYNIGLNYNYIKVPKAHSKHMDFFEIDEIEEILKTIDKVEKNSISKARTKLLVVLWFTSGMRISEMVQLKVSDVLKWKTTIIWKGQKERPVYFTKKCKGLLLSYLRARKMPLPSTWKVAENKEKENWVFISHNPKTFWKQVAINTLCEHNKFINDNLKIEWKKFSAHTMRHSSATYMLDQWANIREIQEFLGHQDLNTTQWYVHIRNKQLENVHNRVFWNF